MKAKNIIVGFLAGVFGGIVVDLIFITFAGPSALFSLIGITERASVFLAHAVLGGVMGIIFIFFVKRFPSTNVWLAGESWALICMMAVGGIPAAFYYPGIPSLKITLFGFLVWFLYGFILAAAVKYTKPYEERDI